VIWQKQGHPLAARFARAALGLFVIEVLVGAANVWTDLNSVIVTTHLLVGGLIWSSLIALAVVTRPALEGAEQRRTLRTSPALESH
jgi:heme A synthase